MKLQRHGTSPASRLTATLALSACGSDNDDSPTRRRRVRPRPRDCATGTLNAQGSSAQKNAMDEWIKAYQQQCAGATINYEPHRLRRRHPGVHRRHRRLRRLRLRAQGRRSSRRPTPSAPAARRIHLPMVDRPGRGRLQRRPAWTTCSSTPATLAKIFAGKITKWDDAGDQGRQPGRQAAVDHHPDRPPLGRVGHHRQLHQVPDQDRRGRLDLRQRPRRGRPRAAPAPRAPTAWPAAVKGTDGTIGYVELVVRREQPACRWPRSATARASSPS